jgi:hypothetical protein
LEVDNVPGIPNGRVKSPYTVVASGPSIESGPYPEETESWDFSSLRFEIGMKPRVKINMN